jgi:hypothetical protein
VRVGSELNSTPVFDQLPILLSSCVLEINDGFARIVTNSEAIDPPGQRFP